MKVSVSEALVKRPIIQVRHMEFGVWYRPDPEEDDDEGYHYYLRPRIRGKSNPDLITVVYAWFCDGDSGIELTTFSPEIRVQAMPPGFSVILTNSDSMPECDEEEEEEDVAPKKKVSNRI